MLGLCSDVLNGQNMRQKEAVDCDFLKCVDHRQTEALDAVEGQTYL
jgi:hypothetical protein